MTESTVEDARTAVDERLYAYVGTTLLVGLVTSIAVMAIGLAANAAKGKAAASTVLSLDRVVPHLLKGDPASILDSGLLLLFATPLLAVLVAFGGFLAQRDVPFALVTGLLLVLLLVACGIALY